MLHPAAGLVVVTDVYAAREDPEPGVDGALVAAAARRARPDLDCVYEPERTALAARVADLVQPGDLVLTLGAGDITTLADELAPLLGARGQEEAGGGAVDSPEPAADGSATLPPGGLSSRWTVEAQARRWTVEAQAQRGRVEAQACRWRVEAPARGWRAEAQARRWRGEASARRRGAGARW